MSQGKPLTGQWLCRYSPGGIKPGLCALKGKDRAAGATLLLAQQHGLTTHVVTFTITHYGSVCGPWYSSPDMENSFASLGNSYKLAGLRTLDGKPGVLTVADVNIRREVILVSCASIHQLNEGRQKQEKAWTVHDWHTALQLTWPMQFLPRSNAQNLKR